MCGHRDAISAINMLILGTNARAMEFARRILAGRERGYRLLGFVDGDWAGLDALKKVGFPVVSDYAGLEEYLRRNVVDEVAIYLPLGSYYKHCSHVANLCQQHGITACDTRRHLWSRVHPVAT